MRIAAGSIVCMALQVALVGYLLLPALVSSAAEPFVMSFYACWPSNAETCVSIIFGSDIAVFLYKYRLRLIALAS